MSASQTTDTLPLYRDPGVPVDQRVEDLLARMTLSEKVAQLGCTMLLNVKNQDLGGVLGDGMGTLAALNMSLTGDNAADMAALREAQRYLVEETRLGIPTLAHSEGIAGAQIPGAVAFPQSIGAAATWEPDWLERAGAVVRATVLAFGIHALHSPLFDLGRDPRWGRIGETYGEDPYLVAQMGCAFVRGVQGDHEVMATAKHFVAYGNTEGGRNGGEAQIGARRLLDTFCFPFEAAIHEAGLDAVMNAYGLVNEEPVATSHYLLTEVLRGKLGFDGPLVADYGSIHRALGRYRTALTAQEAGVQALLAGIDVEQPNNACYQHLPQALAAGRLAEADIDVAVRRILREKFRLGLFEDPYARGDFAATLADPAAARLALDMAAASAVLLANDGTLPLRPGVKVAVVGPSADDATVMFGGYSALGTATVSSSDQDRTEEDAYLKAAYEAVTGEFREQFMKHAGLDIQGDPTPEQRQQIMAILRAGRGASGKTYTTTAEFLERFHPGCQTVRAALADACGDAYAGYAPGCKLREALPGGIDAALAVAAGADVIVAVVGGKESMRAEDATCGENRDNANIDLEPPQRELMRALFATGKPVVTVLIDGRPLAVREVAERAAALTHAWLPGQEGGRAIAQVLTGQVNPGGKLPVTVARHAGQVPLHYDRLPFLTDDDLASEYLDPADNLPLFPFGHGLSYTTFAYSGLEVDPEVPAGATATARFSLANTGGRDGDEVVQVYASMALSSVARPVRQLVGFKRLTLAAGQSVRLEFALDTRQLAFHDHAMAQVIEPGLVKLEIGASSADIRLKGQFEVTGAVTPVARKAFTSSLDVTAG